MCSENHLHFDYVRLAWDAGFCFEENNTKNAFDISTLGLVDIDKVTRERDIATVERHIPTILQFRLDEELTRILEPTFVKIFKLCQLSLQYLRFCNKYLDNTVIILKKDLSTSNDENINLSNIIEQMRIENSNLNIKNKELKEAFNNFNQSVSFKCHDCTKSFATEEFLQAHVSRRHGQLQSESEKLQLEIKELKERLNSTEKYIQQEKDEPDNDAVFDDKEAVLQAKFEQLKEHIEKELSVLRDESFYRSMYEKWFEEIFLKLKYETTPKKVFIEQGSGDCVQVTESSTQTNVVEERVEAAPKAMPRSVQKVEIVDGMEEMERRLKVENDSRREMFENMLEQKIVGSLGKLETQMNVFGRKLEDLELKKLETRTTEAVQEKEKPKQHPTPTKVNPSIQKSRYITAAAPVATNDNSSESNSESENVPPKPAQRTLRPSPLKKPVPPPRPPVMNKRDGKFGSEENKPIRVASFNKNKNDKSSDSSAVFDETMKKTKSKPHTRKVCKTVLKENVQRRKKLEEAIESSDENASSKSPTQGEQLLEGLRDELEEMFNLRLKEIGVAPQWKGLPTKNFKHAISVIEHQASLSSKSVPNYSKIRDEIVKLVNKDVGRKKRVFQENKQKGSKTVRIQNRGVSTADHPPRKDVRDSEAVAIFQTSSDSHRSSSDDAIQPASSPERVAGKIAGKKKVLFDLRGEDSVQMIKPVSRDFAGSASSLGSSVLDRNEGVDDDKTTKRYAEKEESDWDISDIVV